MVLSEKICKLKSKSIDIGLYIMSNPTVYKSVLNTFDGSQEREL